MKKLTNTFVYIFAAFLAVILVMNIINLWSGASVTGVSDVIIGVLYSLLMLTLALCIKNAKNTGGKSRIFILLAIIFVGTAVLVEIGYHDNYSDALWLESHVEDVARQLVKALTEYFGLPFIQPMDPVRGTVRVSYGTLNLRSTPSSSGTVIANLPNGAEVTVYGEWNGWYVVQYGDQVGYAAAAYIDV